VATHFDQALHITGAILTKLDGDARGGAALSLKSVTGKPIKFVGVGEKLEDFEPFHPERMASRILGMGDVVSLVERRWRRWTWTRRDGWKKRCARASSPSPISWNNCAR